MRRVPVLLPALVNEGNHQGRGRAIRQRHARTRRRGRDSGGNGGVRKLTLRRVARFVWPLIVLLTVVSACGGSGNDSPNDVSSPAIDRRFAVDAEGRQLALLCYGEGSPMVFLEPASGAGDDFKYMMRQLGELTTTCTYDRAGYGRSDPPAKARRTLDDAAADLRALIE